MLRLVIGAALAEEDHEHLPEHVEGGEPGDDETDGPERGRAVWARERLPEDLVLREEPGEGRDAGDGEGRDDERGRGGGQVTPEPAHLPHVLLAAHGVNDAAG